MPSSTSLIAAPSQNSYSVPAELVESEVAYALEAIEKGYFLKC